MAQKNNVDLSTLPHHIIKLNKHWYKNVKTGSWILADKITDHLPKTPISHEIIMDKRYDLKY